MFMKSKGPGGEGITRRSFLGYIASALGAFIATVVATPVVGSFISPALKKQEAAANWVDLGPVSRFAVGEPKLVKLTLVKRDGWVETALPRVVWVVRKEDCCTVYNAQCTHLGCIVDYHPEDNCFKSPCHGGMFDLEDGRVLGGPPPRPLDQLECREDGGQLSVNYQDFRLGIPGKVPIV